MIYELEAFLSSWDLNRWSTPQVTDEEKYANLWGVVFPGEDFRGRFPSGVGGDRWVRTMQAARGYWERNGMEVVGRVFEGRTGDERRVLFGVVLEEILRGMLTGVEEEAVGSY